MERKRVKLETSYMLIELILMLKKLMKVKKAEKEDKLIIFGLQILCYFHVVKTI